MATTTEVPARLADLDDEDFAAWVRTQVDALRAPAASGAALPGLDLPRLVEEVEDSGAGERRGVETSVISGCAHLLWPRNRHGLAKP